MKQSKINLIVKNEEIYSESQLVDDGDEVLNYVEYIIGHSVKNIYIIRIKSTNGDISLEQEAVIMETHGEEVR